MSYQDTMVTCEQCGKKFVFRVEEQRRLDRQGKEVSPPDLCPSCRPESSAPPRPSTPSPPSKPSRSRAPKEEEHASKEEKIEATVALGPGPHEGTIKWFDGEKGYGFVAHPDGAEIFFHRTGIASGEGREFPDGTPVTFIIEQTEKGPQAVEVARLDAEE